MAPMFSNIKERFMAFWEQTSLGQRSFLVGISILAIVAFIGMVLWMNQPDYRVLYANLSQEDASRVVTTLQGEKIEYKLENNGQTILVPAGRNPAPSGKLPGA